MNTERFIIVFLVMVLTWVSWRGDRKADCSSVGPSVVSSVPSSSVVDSRKEVNKTIIQTSPAKIKTHEKTDQKNRDLNSQGLNESQQKVIEWRVNGISNLISLTDSQKDRLIAKYSSDLAGSNDPLNKGESLEDIIGKDNANLYLSARQRAKEKVKSEDLEKDVLYRSRLLNLSSVDEENLRQAVFAVDANVESFLEEQRKTQQSSRNPYQGFALYIEAEKLRRNLLNAEVKKFLDPIKYEDYLKQDAESAASEVTMWHE